jgi:hypothetical protein
MALPNSLHGPHYFTELAALRDEALTASHTYGGRYRIGKFVLGTARAEWTTSSNGIAVLQDRGIRTANGTLWLPRPTRLSFYDHYGGGYGSRCGTQVSAFDMDLDNTNDIAAYAYNAETGEPINTPRAKHAALTPEKPTDQQLMRIYNEIGRGATGEYKLQVSYVDGA